MIIIIMMMMMMLIMMMIRVLDNNLAGQVTLANAQQVSRVLFIHNERLLLSW